MSAADVPQLRGRQLTSQAGNCDNDVCHDHGYTGYDHKNSGTPKAQREVDIEQGVNEWWRCAKKCSEGPFARDCDGWTFAYNGNGGPYKCYLKVGLTPQPDWQTDPNVISGWSATPELSSESPGDPLCSALSPTDPVPCPDVKGSSGASISHDPKIQCVYNPKCLKESLHGCFEETGCQYIYLSTPEENALLAHAARAADRRARLAANSTECAEVGLYMTGTEWTQVCQRMCPGSQSTPIGHGGNCWQCWCHGQGVQPPTALPDPGYEDLVSGAFPGCCASNTYPQSEKDPCGSWQLKEKGQC